MNDYVELRIDMNPCSSDMTDLLAAFLADAGYESFVPDDNGLIAYIKAENFDNSALKEIISDFPMPTSMTVKNNFVEGKDWNEEWEKNYFKPIVVGGRCVVHSSFHTDIPQAEFDIVVDPKMAFGTGHHATTSQMLKLILEADTAGKDVIDMGTGTGILAILCKMKGAASASGIDIEKDATDNAALNASLNKVEIDFITGDSSVLESLGKADIFLANINRNVILADMHLYARHLKDEGSLMLSGFYTRDIPLIEEEAAKYGLKIANSISENDWAALRLTFK